MAMIRTFWYGEGLSPYEQLCLKSFVAYGHKLVVYAYTKIEAPGGVDVIDAATVVPESSVFFYSSGEGAGSPSAFSNLFRYELLYRYGDWWCDTDVICLSAELPSGEVVFGYENEHYANGAMLKIQLGHPFAQELVAEARRMGSSISWGDAGPKLITRVAAERGLLHLGVAPAVFYPVYADGALDLLDPDHADRIKALAMNSVTLHVWNEMMRQAGIVKTVAPPAGSYLALQCEAMGVTFPSGLRYSHDQIRRVKNLAPWLTVAPDQS